MKSNVANPRVRKKPCPYCEKRLVASSKGKWRNNLARHLANCLPYQREQISMITRFMLDFMRSYCPDLLAASVKDVAGHAADIAELERLHDLEVPMVETQTAPRENTDTRNAPNTESRA